MHFKLIFRVMGVILLIEAGAMLPPLCVSFFCGEPDTLALLISFAVTAAAGGLLAFLLRKARRGIQPREGFAITGFSWVLLSVFGALPFYISGYIPNFADCLFEAVSGFTTTGATVLPDIEALPHGLILWSSLMHWIGGMGVLILFLALLPSMGERSMQLMRAESPGPAPSKLVPRIGGTAKILYGIYISITVVEFLLLWIFGMPAFDSVVHAMGSAGTGGFSLRNLSVGAYPSTAIHLIIGFSMLASGISFAFYYAIIKRSFTEVKKNTEVWVYLCIVAAGVALVAFDITPMYMKDGGTVGLALRDSFFQVSSMATTTGYATADINLWPDFSRTLLVCFMVIGSCAGSTGGGIKTIRLVLIIKGISREIRKIIHPRSVNTIRLARRPVGEEVMSGTTQFFASYIIILLAGTVIVSLDGNGFTTSLTAVISCLSNVGRGLDLVEHAGGFSVFSALSRGVLSLCMLIGRLEIFPILVLFAPATWKKV